MIKKSKKPNAWRNSYCRGLTNSYRSYGSFGSNLGLLGIGMSLVMGSILGLNFGMATENLAIRHLNYINFNVLSIVAWNQISHESIIEKKFKIIIRKSRKKT